MAERIILVSVPVHIDGERCGSMCNHYMWFAPKYKCMLYDEYLHLPTGKTRPLRCAACLDATDYQEEVVQQGCE